MSAFPPPPSRVWIGASAFTVKGVAADDPLLEDARGITDIDKAAIYYDATRSAREQFEVIWHELTHAVNSAFSLLIPRKRLTEERVATVHGHGWTQVLMDNPALLSWLAVASAYIKSEQESIEA